MSGPQFDDLVGGEVAGTERERLRRVHELLVEAGPPPELPESLASPPGFPRDPSIPVLPPNVPRRRIAASLVLAAALAVLAFGAGFFVANRGDEETFPVDFSLVMRGTGATPDARALLEVGEIDDAGNWPMRMTVRNLPALPAGYQYELFLTKKGKNAASCGRFAVKGDKTVVFLNAPYKFSNYDGWVVLDHETSRNVLETGEIAPA